MTGHQEMPSEAVEYLESKLRVSFPEANNVVVVSSLAIGADTIVSKYLLARGAELHVIVPSNDYVSTFKSDSDRSTFEDLLLRANVVEYLGSAESDEAAFMAAGALVARSCDWLIAVWDGEKSRGLGGTGDVVALARELGKDVRVIWPAGLSR